MKTRLILLLTILIIGTTSRYVEHKARTVAETNTGLRFALLTLDGIAFMQNGGGALGYDNYFKWSYAKWVTAPERTIIQRILFWDRGFMYEAGNPPETYSYSWGY